MSVSFSANVVYGLPIIRTSKAVTKTMYNPNTGKPYEVEDDEDEIVVGGKVVSEDWLEGLFCDPICEHSTGMNEEFGEGGMTGILGMTLAKADMDDPGNGVSEINELSYTQRLEFEAFCNKHGLVGEPKFYLVGYVG